MRNFVLSVLMFVALFPVLSSCSADDSASYTSIVKQFNFADFADNTEKYRGKVLKMGLFVTDAGLFKRRSQHSLREYVGKTVKLSNHGEDKVMLDILITIPSGLSVPNAMWGDDVIVEFRCVDGSLRSGNEAISIERPK